jgi:hypothetical protein
MSLFFLFFFCPTPWILSSVSLEIILNPFFFWFLFLYLTFISPVSYYLILFLQMCLRVLASTSVQKYVIYLLCICSAPCFKAGPINISDELGTSHILSSPTSTTQMKMSLLCNIHLWAKIIPAFLGWSYFMTPCMELNLAKYKKLLYHTTIVAQAIKFCVLQWILFVYISLWHH